MNPRPEDACWLPVAEAAALRPDAPLAVARAGEPIVLWHDGSEAHAFTDRCPHRGASLSLGRVHAGALECAYHGWRFDGRGQCVAVPALPGFVPPEGHRAKAWQVQVAHGLVWVAGVAAGPPPAFDGLPARRVLCGPYDVATSAPRVVENFLDTAHFGFVHDGWLGDRAQVQVPDYRVETDAQGRPGVPHYRAWQPRAHASATEGAWVDYRYQVLGAYAALLEKRADGDGPAEAYALWVCPTEAEASRVWFTLFTGHPTRSDAELIAFQSAIFAQDAPILASQRPRLLPVSGGELHCAADRLSVAYRRWLVAERITFGVC